MELRFWFLVLTHIFWCSAIGLGWFSTVSSVFISLIVFLMNEFFWCLQQKTYFYLFLLQKQTYFEMSYLLLLIDPCCLMFHSSRYLVCWWVVGGGHDGNGGCFSSENISVFVFHQCSIFSVFIRDGRLPVKHMILKCIDSMSCLHIEMHLSCTLKLSLCLCFTFMCSRKKFLLSIFNTADLAK